MADVEAGRVDGEGKHVPINHPRRRLLFLAIVLQVIGAVVPLAMEIGLMKLKNPNAFRKFLLMAVPWTSLLTVIAVCIQYKQRRQEKEEGEVALLGFKFLCLVAALLLFASTFFVWLWTINGWKFGHVFSYAPIVSTIILLITSGSDLLNDA